MESLPGVSNIFVDVVETRGFPFDAFAERGDEASPFNRR